MPSRAARAFSVPVHLFRNVSYLNHLGHALSMITCYAHVENEVDDYKSFSTGFSRKMIVAQFMPLVRQKCGQIEVTSRLEASPV